MRPHSPFVVALPNGYYLQRDRNSDIDLVRRGVRDVLDGPIAAYTVKGDVITGCVGQWPQRSGGYPNESAFPDSAECRYFVLRSRMGNLDTGLDRKSWRARLAELGLPESLEITAPVLPR